ncbi:MAG: SIMPL domain-containing protein, partial [Candidatus Woesebacteria bacterium]|nr:SIMPL domain-containing protein [Candidatus Woesebacteria bacterium]
FTKINDLIASSTSFGANMVGGVNFDLSDNLKKEKLQEARDLAITEAKNKASGLAKAAGISLGKIVNVSEDQNGGIRALMLPSAGGGVADKAVTQPNVQPGTTEIDVTISLSYEVR